MPLPAESTDRVQPVKPGGDSATKLRVIKQNIKPAALRHGVSGLGRQVHQHLLHARRLGVMKVVAAPALQMDIDTFGLHALKQFNLLLDRWHKVHRLRTNAGLRRRSRFWPIRSVARQI